MKGYGKEKYQRPSAQEIKAKLSELQYNVTQNDATEPPFDNAFWNKKDDGIYVDIISGEPLFSSRDKFDSGTGWPSFTQPLAKEHIVLNEDRKLFTRRTEVRSQLGQSHLGHVFDDGPAPSGLRYCINSAALRFIPANELEKEGYGEYANLFSQGKAVATFAGGCFWCMEPPFDQLSGVLSTNSGYIGGHEENPSYELVSSGKTNYAEALQIEYDPRKVSYAQLLQVFWRNIDPGQADGQFCDHGRQYRSEIFYHSDEQKKLAESSKQELQQSGKFAQIHTAISDAASLKFYPAESYHQDYYRKNPVRYKFYRYRCGRDQRLKALWGGQ